MPTTDRRDERGETLLEIIVAIAILGIAAVVIVAGMTISIKVSDIHRKEANAGSYVRDFAESIVGVAATTNGYVGCESLTSAQKASTLGGYVAYTPPLGYSASISGIQYLTAAGASGNPGASAVFAGSCTTDLGAQQLTIQVKSSDGRAIESLIVVVRKPCSKTSATCT